MRILHLSHTGLPDLRIEKYALTMRGNSHELIFLGGRPTKYQNLNAFDRVLFVPLGNNLEAALSPFVKQKWLKSIDKIKPDIIHAHDVWVARFALDTEYPVIYDDHEYWSKQIQYHKVKSPKTRLTFQPAKLLIPHWERELVSRYPVLTTTENTAKEHRRFSRWVGVTRNVPSKIQIEGLVAAEERHGLVYTGGDFALPEFQPYRDMTGLRRVLEFDIVTGLKHREMMEKLTSYQIGLTPWLPHHWHPYSDPNRNYEYLHAGLQIAVNSILKSSFKDDKYVHAFRDYTDIVSVIQSIQDEDPEKIRLHAMKSYIWENQTNVIKEAYNKA
jgi:hypothetical protein